VQISKFGHVMWTMIL